MHSVLGILTGGWIHGQAYWLPVDRTLVIRGSLLDIGGRPTPGVEVIYRSQVAPAFNEDALLNGEARTVYTDANGAFSTTRQNQVQVLRSTTAEDCYVRLTIPAAGADWVFRMPSSQNVVLLKDLVRERTVLDLTRAPER